MMTVMPSNCSSIATCLYQKPMGNGITDPHRKKQPCPNQASSYARDEKNVTVTKQPSYDQVLVGNRVLL
jgi:hypothetical protein